MENTVYSNNILAQLFSIESYLQSWVFHKWCKNSIKKKVSK